jgi:carbon-monoxide dehydrogenase medium subunit
MYPKAFEYARAESLGHAIELLAQHGYDAKLLAGGASLIPLMKLRLASPAFVVDIGRLTDLSFVRRENGTLALGPLTRHAEVESDPLVQSSLPMLRDVAGHIGDTQVRNMGTVGGGLAEADPAGDWGPALLALNGSVIVRGPNGVRTIAASGFFVDPYTTALEHDEVITEVRFPVWSGIAGGAHLKLERRAGDFAIANCSVAVQLDGDGRLAQIGIGLGGVGLSPVKISAAEDLLRGKEPGREIVEAAAREVSKATEAFSDARASADYRQHVAGVLFQRALEAARRRALGQEI